MKEGWEYKKLGEVADFCRGLTYKREDEVDSSDNCVLRSNNIDLESMSLNFEELKYIRPDFVIPEDKKLKANSVFVCMSNGSKQHVGKVAYVNEDMNYAFGGFMGLIVPKPQVRGKYIYYVCRSSLFRHFLDQIGNGIGITNLRFSDLNEFSIPFPPLSEQQHIVEELDLLSSIIEKKKAQLNELDNLAQSLFYEMFGDPITNDKGWEVMTLEAISHLITDGSHYSPKDDAKGVIPMLSVKDMRQTHFSYGSCKWIGKVEYNQLVANGCKPLKDDVLIAKDGSFFKYIFVLTQEREQAILSSIAILRPKVSLVNPHYVARYLSTKEIFSKVEREYLTGTAIKRVILKGIRKMPIILPPLALQQQFASKIEAIEHQKELIKQSIKEVEMLFNSRMDHYFN